MTTKTFMDKDAVYLMEDLKRNRQIPELVSRRMELIYCLFNGDSEMSLEVKLPSESSLIVNSLILKLTTPTETLTYQWSNASDQ